MSQFPPDRVLVEYSPVRHVEFDLVPASVPTSIAFVQSNGAFNSSTSSLAATFTSNVTSGNLLVAATVANGLTGTYGAVPVSDTVSSTWHGNLAVLVNPGGAGLNLWWARAGASGANTVTWAIGSTETFTRLIIQEFSGVTALDQEARATGAAYPLDSGGVTTTHAAELLLAWGCSDNGVTTPGANYTISFTQNSESTEYRIVSSTGVYHGLFPGDGASSNWGCILNTFN